MKFVLYSLHDLAAERYDVPVPFENDMIAQATIMREFEIVAESDDNLKKKILSDTVLEKVGYFDTDTGLLSTVGDDEPKIWIYGVDFLDADVEDVNNGNEE